MKTQKILVTGVGGLWGGTIADYLLHENFDVTGIYRKHKPKSKYKIVQADLSQNLSIQDEKFDAIVHVAGEKPVRKSEIAEYAHQNFIDFKVNNIDSMHNLIKFARASNTKKIIYLSTIGVHGIIKDSVLNEDSYIINPDAYGLTKYCAEMLLKSCDDIQGISLRLPGIIGKGASDIWFTNVIKKMKNNEKIMIYTPDFVTKNFVWIYDLCRFIKILTECDTYKYDTLTLGCKEGITIRNLIALMLEKTGSHSEICIDNSLRSPFCIDSSRAQEMGYISLSPNQILEEYVKCTK